MSTDFIIENLEEQDYSQKPREQVRYIGQISAIRYFNPSDRIDAIRLKKIINDPKVQHWMRELNLTDKEYIEWMKDQGPGKNRKYHLFAVSGAENITQKEIGEVQGFVNFYFSPDEQQQVQQVVDEGLLRANDIQGKNILEISFAKSSDAPSGRMSGGIMQACLQVSKILQRKSDTDPTNILIVAYTDPNNVISEEILIRSGFKKIGKVDSYIDEQSPNNVFILDWQKLNTIAQSETLNLIKSKSLSRK